MIDLFIVINCIQLVSIFLVTVVYLIDNMLLNGLHVYKEDVILSSLLSVATFLVSGLCLLAESYLINYIQ